MSQIDRLRARIDELDDELVRLLNERAGCAVAIGHLKELAGIAVYQPAREAEVLAHVRRVNAGPLDGDALVRVFERIIDEARRLERIAATPKAPESGTVESHVGGQRKGGAGDGAGE